MRRESDFIDFWYRNVARKCYTFVYFFGLDSDLVPKIVRNRIGHRFLTILGRFGDDFRSILSVFSYVWG